MATQTKKYVVVSDAVVVTIGKKANGRAMYTRVVRGGLVNGNPESEQIQTLLRQGSIVQAKNAQHAEELKHPRNRRTVREAARRMGAPDDPVQAPLDGVEPLPAGDPSVDPESLTLDDVTEEADAESENV